MPSSVSHLFLLSLILSISFLSAQAAAKTDPVIEALEGGIIGLGEGISPNLMGCVDHTQELISCGQKLMSGETGILVILPCFQSLMFTMYDCAGSIAYLDEAISQFTSSLEDKENVFLREAGASILANSPQIYRLISEAISLAEDGSYFEMGRKAGNALMKILSFWELEYPRSSTYRKDFFSGLEVGLTYGGWDALTIDSFISNLYAEFEAFRDGKDAGEHFKNILFLALESPIMLYEAWDNGMYLISQVVDGLLASEAGDNWDLLISGGLKLVYGFWTGNYYMAGNTLAEVFCTLVPSPNSMLMQL